MSFTMHNCDYYPDEKGYIVAQIDMEATVAHVKDQSVRSQVREIGTAKCLLFLHTLNSVVCPWESRTTFTYRVSAVGAGLRPANAEHHATPDMCMPIYPAVYHPTGRPPLRTFPVFPFTNCYQWFGPDVGLNVRMKKAQYSHEEGDYVGLSFEECAPMYRFLEEDKTRRMTEKALDGPTQTPSGGLPGPRVNSDDTPSPSQALQSSSALQASTTDHVDDDLRKSSKLRPVNLQTPAALALASSPSVHVSQASADGADHQPAEPLSSPEEAGSIWSQCDNSLFSNPGRRRSCDTLDLMEFYELQGVDMTTHLPIVHAWTDLTAHMTQDEIPDPMVFIEKCAAISRILKKYQDEECAAFRTKMDEYRERYKREKREEQDGKESHYTASVWGPEDSISSGTKPGRRRWQRIRACVTSALTVCRSLLCVGLPS